MANGMSSLYVGVSGLQSAQTAINTTAHNLSNVNTTGFTRQQVTFRDTHYITIGSGLTKTSVPNYGMGVAVSEIRRIRDEFIDSAYRSENSRLGYYNSQYKAIEEVEDQFGEMQGVTYQECLTNLYTSINELSKNTSSTVARSSLLQNATAFITRSTAVYQGLKDYQSTLNTEVVNMVNKINTLGNTIHDLNKKIAKIEATGLEDANDLRDQRDNALDELAGYIDIDYYESDNGETIVTAEGIPFVTVTCVNEMATRKTEGTQLLIPTWEAFERDVYEEGEKISNIANTDKGELKGLLAARGNITVDYTDVPVKPVQSDYDLTTAKGQQEYQDAYAEYEKKQAYYNKYIEPSVILSAMAGLDKLVNGVVEAINNVLCPEKQVTMTAAMKDANGNDIQADKYQFTSNQATLYDRNGAVYKGTDNGDGTYSYTTEEQLFLDKTGKTAVKADSYTYTLLDMDKTDYGMDHDKTVGQELFSRLNTSRYVTSSDGKGNTIYVRNNLNTRGQESLYTVSNIEMNPVIMQDKAKIPLSTLQGEEDLKRGSDLVDLWNKDFASLNPDQYAVTDFNTFYNNFIGEFATAGNVLNNYVSNQQTMVSGYNNQRNQTAGVSSDEELEKMIKYQQAYNAASRYINVVSEMMEHLVTSLGS
jgi:flagellar hook-associated protein 1 FlgK